jgi:hypothetical protein
VPSCNNPDAARHDGAANAGDKRSRLRSHRADADGVGLAGNTKIPDLDIVAAGGEIDPGSIAQGELLPVVLLKSAPTPAAVLKPPVVFVWSALKPLAVFWLPVELSSSAPTPVAVLSTPVVLLESAL